MFASLLEYKWDGNVETIVEPLY